MNGKPVGPTLSVSVGEPVGEPDAGLAAATLALTVNGSPKTVAADVCVAANDVSPFTTA